ncbi:MAG: hypothetical protein HYT37_01325 [Candidatus Sungbacteria bacterium]|nr:hypothetical protein [Candidatus Sungbacteria bacterium]
METTTPPANIAGAPRFRGEMMRQIYRVWLFRKLLPVLFLEIAVIAAVLYQLGQAVFLQRIFENGTNVLFNNPSGILSFVISAFTNAPVLTKILALGFAVLLALIVRHLTQGMLRFILVRANYFSKIK